MGTPKEEARARSEVLLNRAIALDPELAEAHTARGYLRLEGGDCKAFQVRRMTNTFGHSAGTRVSLNVRSGFASQLSVAPAVPVAGGSVGSPHSTVALGGHSISGGVVSVTQISCSSCPTTRDCSCTRVSAM